MRSTNPGWVPDSPLRRQLTPEWLAFFRTFPKAETHCHLLGTIAESTFRDLVRESGASVSDAEISAFYTRGEKPVGVLKIFRTLEAQVLREPEMLRRIALEHLERAASLGVRWIEFSWNWTGLSRWMSYADGARAIQSALLEAPERFGISGCLIPAIDREASPEDACRLVEEVLSMKDRSLVPGIGIDYRETGHEPENFWKAFRLASEGGLKITIHAGEFGEHWRNVETAVDLLGACRIDHGYTIVDNPELVERAKRLALPFAVVPTNSYYLRTLEPDRWAFDHPIRRMRDLGLSVYPNSDDPTMHRVSIDESWRIPFEFFGFSLEDTRRMLAASIEASWADASDARRWRVEWLEEFDRLAAGLPVLSTD